MENVEALKELKAFEPITILGHRNTDVDSCCSGILMQKVFEHLGIKSKFVVEDTQIDQNTEEVMKYLGEDMAKYMGTVNQNESVFLVDNHDNQSNGFTIGCIDHHPTEQSLSFPVYHNKKRASCSMHIYDIIDALGMEIDGDTAKMIVTSAYVDTCSFRSSKAQPGDKERLEPLITKYNLDMEEIEKLGLSLNDISMENMFNAVQNGRKDFQYGEEKVQVGTSYVQIWGMQDFNEMYTIPLLRTLLLNYEKKLWVFLVVDFKESKTYEYRVTESNHSYIVHDGIVSRGNDIMPIIEKLILTGQLSL